MRKLLTVILLMSVLLALPAGAQITISTNTFNPAVGTVIENKLDASAGATFYNTVSTGTGGPMIWDFTGHSFGTAYSIHIVNPATAPSADSFPGANLVLMAPRGNDTSWLVHKSFPTSFFRMGTVVRGTSGLNVIVYGDTTVDWVFPLNYGNQWTAFRHWTQHNPTNYSKFYDTTVYNVDGWGNAKYGSKLVPCLRVISTERLTTMTYNLSNVLLGTSTTTIVTVNFVAAGFVTIAAVTKSSSSGFDFYSGYALVDFINQQTAVDEQPNDILPVGFSLEQNYPNPFNPRTLIQFDLPVRADVRVTVFNLAGQVVKVLVDKSMAPGTYVADWDGTNQVSEPVATGVYLYRLEAGSFSQTKKMLLLK